MPYKTPKISVIVPTYNAAPYLHRCLDSIKNQSYTNLEIIAVDDQSTDNTLDILESYQEKLGSYKIFKTKRKGLGGGARNLGLEHARGEYISFVDNDDWLDTNFYLHMVGLIENQNADICIAGVKREYDNAKNSLVRYKYNANNTIDGEYALALLTRIIDQDISISAILCNKLFRSDFIRTNNFRFVENSLNEDDVFMFEAFLKAVRVSITSETYYHLYQRRNSASRSFSKKHIDDLFAAFCRIKETLASSGSYQKYMGHYYAFFEKCFSYLLESLRLSTQDEKVITKYLSYAFSISGPAITLDEFVEYCGSKRLMSFFYEI